MQKAPTPTNKARIDNKWYNACKKSVEKTKKPCAGWAQMYKVNRKITITEDHVPIREARPEQSMGKNSGNDTVGALRNKICSTILWGQRRTRGIVPHGSVVFALRKPFPLVAPDFFPVHVGSAHHQATQRIFRRRNVSVKQPERQDASTHNVIEGKFGKGKTKYGLDCIMARLLDTLETMISLVFLCMNIIRRLRLLFTLFWLIPIFGKMRVDNSYQKNHCCVNRVFA